MVTYLLILIFKYLCEKSIFEKFQDLPQIDNNDLKLLTRLAHSFVKGEPFKINNPLSSQNFYIGNRLLNLYDLPPPGGSANNFSSIWENFDLIEVMSKSARTKTNLVTGGI